MEQNRYVKLQMILLCVITALLFMMVIGLGVVGSRVMAKLDAVDEITTQVEVIGSKVEQIDVSTLNAAIGELQQKVSELDMDAVQETMENANSVLESVNKITDSLKSASDALDKTTAGIVDSLGILGNNFKRQ